MSKKFTEEQLVELEKAYAETKNIWEVGPMFGVCAETCRKHLKARGVYTSKKILFSEKDLEIMGREYSSGKSLLEVGEMFGVTAETCRKALRNTDVEMRKCGWFGAGKNLRTYSVDQEYFDKIDTEDKAYWLGFLSADGNVDKGLHSIRLKLKDTDFHHLEKFRDCLKSDHPITKGSAERKQWGKVYSNCEIIINSYKLANSLSRLGVTPRKSLTLRPCSEIPQELRRHYWRGVLDGDGSVCVSKYSSIGIYGSLWMVEGFRDFLSDFGVNITTVISRNGQSIFRFFCTSRTSVEEAANLLYKDSTVYLDRKYKKYQELLELYTN